MSDTNYYHIEYRKRQLLCVLYLKRKLRQRKTNRKACFWVRPIFLKRKEQGAHNLIQEMRHNDPEKFTNYFRMTILQFDRLLKLVEPRIEKLHLFRVPITTSERLACTLRYLASGDSMVSISYSFRIGVSTVSNIILETCLAIWEVLEKEVFSTPSKDDWLNISRGFFEKWQFPNCIGAIDGKHVQIQAPPNSGSSFYNYKGTHSVVLLAICDSSYKFTMVDIGAQGRQSDGGIFKASALATYFENSIMFLPNSTALKPLGPKLPYVIVADAAFQLSKYLMKPFPGTRKNELTEDKEIFNYRLSRARRVIENAFGILVSKWRIYRKPIIAKLETVEAIIQATVVLHNYLLQEEEILPMNARTYCPPILTDREDSNGIVTQGNWRNVSSALRDVNNTGSNTYTKSAAQIRDAFKDHFSTAEGAVPWQWDRVRDKKYY